MRRLLLAFVLLAASACHAATCIAVPAKTHGTATSNTIDTTGSSILVGASSSYSGYSPVFNDSLGNRDWNSGQEYDISGTGSGPFSLLLYEPNPKTAANYTFSIPTGGTYLFVSGTVYSCSGVTTDHPLAQQTGINTTGAATNFQPGPVTPVEAGDLIFTALTCNTNTLTASINSGFSTPVVNNSVGFVATATSWLSAPNTTPVNPTWSTNFAPCIAWISVFKATGAAPPPNVGQYISSPVGTGHEAYGGDGGPAINAYIDYPGEIIKPSNGLVCFSDVNNNRIRCFNPTAGPLTAPWVGSPTIAAGNIATVAGTGTLGYGGDGGPPLSAQFAHPVGLGIDAADCVYIADQQNAEIRRFCPGGNISTIAGGGGSTFAGGCHTTGQSRDVAGFSGDGGLATLAAISCPQGVTVDPSGAFIVISDSANYRVRAVNLTGSPATLFGVSICAGCIKTIMGQGSRACTMTGAGTTSVIGTIIGSGDLDVSGNLYYPMYDCNAVWKLSTAGVPSRIAGTNGVQGYAGDGGLATSATMRYPFTLKRSTVGDIYITDTGNSVIRFVDHTTGFISTVAGNFGLYPYYSPTTWNSGGYCCDGGPANLAGLGYPIGLWIDEANHYVYESDLLMSRIRRLYDAALVIGGSQLTGKSQFTGKSQVQ